MLLIISSGNQEQHKGAAVSHASALIISVSPFLLSMFQAHPNAIFDRAPANVSDPGSSF